jgi:hypothetical protein
MTTIPTWLSVFHFSDFFRGCIVGVGIGLEICGLILIIRRKKRGEVRLKEV